MSTGRGTRRDTGYGVRPCQRRYAATTSPNRLPCSEREVGERNLVDRAVALDAGDQTGAGVRSLIDRGDLDLHADDTRGLS